MEKQIETVVEMAANKYPLIHPDIDDYENEECILQRKAFIEGYKAANAAVQGYREALEKIAGGYYGKVAIVEMAAEALSKAEYKGDNYILITDVKNLFNASVFLYELMQVANIKNEDGMQVVEYINKSNGGSVAYLRHDAVVKKLNTILQSLPNHIGEANEMIASKAEGKGEGARYTIDEIIGFINQEELTIPIEKFFREDGSHITKKEYGIVVLNELCIALKERFKPQPTNSLDELERWVAELLVSEVFEIDTLRLINKIQELKTITP
jgi:hypothetical protein